MRTLRQRLMRSDPKGQNLLESSVSRENLQCTGYTDECCTGHRKFNTLLTCAFSSVCQLFSGRVHHLAVHPVHEDFSLVKYFYYIYIPYITLERYHLHEM
ncbi:hypothetical protein ACOSQ3_026594 [Xanthoceras sorbifolium]